MGKIDVSTPKIDITPAKGSFTFHIKGNWTSRTAQESQALCQEILRDTFSSPITFNLSELQEIDTTGVCLLSKLFDHFKQLHLPLKIKNQSKTFQALSEHLSHYSQPTTQSSPSISLVSKQICQLGEATLTLLTLIQELLIFLGQVTIEVSSALCHPKRLHFKSIVAHMERFGIHAIPIVSLISAALGLVLAYQGEEQLRRFGAEIYTINLVSISIVREVGVLITAILVAGRTGSSITAQIGVMKINQEIDALHALGLSSMDMLLIPRILALIIIMPVLTFIADFAGLVGGAIMVIFSLDVSLQLYIHRIGEAITMGGFWIGICKAPLFGAIIAIIACFEGLRVQGTADSIGKCTTRCVVEGIFLVTLADALLSIFFSKIGI